MNQVEQWREDAIADGWSHAPLYPGHKPENSAAKLTYRGWTAQVFNSPERPGWKTQRCIAVWDDKGIAVVVPTTYSWESLQQALTVCMFCSATGVHTQRVSFAGRCCDLCLPEQRKRLEYPGWYN